MSEPLEREFDDALNRLIGEECWGVATGGAVGSMFLLELGAKIPRVRPSRNLALPSIQRTHEGEFSLRVSGASWRLIVDGIMITSSKDSAVPDGPVVEGLERLVGKRVASLELKLPACDLQIDFEGGYRLSVFCDAIEADGENYVLGLRRRYFGVEARSTLSLEEAPG